MNIASVKMEIIAAAANELLKNYHKHVLRFELVNKVETKDETNRI